MRMRIISFVKFSIENHQEFARGKNAVSCDAQVWIKYDHSMWTRAESFRAMTNNLGREKKNETDAVGKST